jgi:magnesium chelatase subunit I
LAPISVKVSDSPEIAVAAAEFLLEGMYAHKRLSRSEERGFTAQEKVTRKQERVEEREYDEFQEQRRSRRGFN